MGEVLGDRRQELLVVGWGLWVSSPLIFDKSIDSGLRFCLCRPFNFEGFSSCHSTTVLKRVPPRR